MLTESQMRKKLIELHNEQTMVKRSIDKHEENNLECDKLYLINAELSGRIGILSQILEGSL